MGFDSFFAGSRATRLLVAALFASRSHLHAGRNLALPVAATNAAATGAGSGTIENSVVKVFSTVGYPDLYKPWTKQPPEEQTGSGVVIEGRRILTNAHVVDYASQVQIQANQAGDKISATVEAIAPGIDLAVLKLDDEKFSTRTRRWSGPRRCPDQGHGPDLRISERRQHSFDHQGNRFAHRVRPL